MTMAQVPDMESDLMDNNSEYEGDFYGVLSNGYKKGVHNSHCISCHRRSCVCSSGIHLEMATEVDSGYSFRKTVVLVVAVEQLKKGLICNTGFKDTDLLNLINDIFVQEEISYEKTEFTSASFPNYKYIKASECNIRDSHNKCMALQQFPGNAKLVAVSLQGLNTQREEKITMSFYATQSLSSEQQAVTLGLAGKNLYLSCTLVEGEAQLHLEEVKDIKEVKNEDLLRFIFQKSAFGSRFTFESASCPGWYISTSQAENELVQMKPEADQRYIREFLVLS
ncbi:interleukin-1 beta-like [Pelobates fuscus]|uniref:interleukin-1 beta-like n=1 Tax=Pelobates fuscus TaxID=191477 RepID=UPI002FE4CCD7